METGELVAWLSTSELGGDYLPESVDQVQFLEHWCTLGGDAAAGLARLNGAATDRFLWNAKESLSWCIWWSAGPSGRHADADLKCRALNATPAILSAACRRAGDETSGCYIFWESLTQEFREVPGNRLIWDATRKALDVLSATASSECLRQAVEHGIDHFRETDRELDEVRTIGTSEEDYRVNRG